MRSFSMHLHLVEFPRTSSAASGHRSFLLADEPGLEFAHRVAAGVREALGTVALVSTHDVLKRRRFGNVVLIASRSALNDAALTRAIAGLSIPSGYWPPAETLRRGGGASALHDGDDIRGPVPPEPTNWRVR